MTISKSVKRIFGGAIAIIAIAFLTMAVLSQSNFIKAKKNIVYFEAAKDEVLKNYNVLQNLNSDRVVKISIEETNFFAGLCQFDKLGETAFEPFLILDQKILVNRPNRCHPFVLMEKGLIEFELEPKARMISGGVAHSLYYSPKGMEVIQNKFKNREDFELVKLRKVKDNWYYAVDLNLEADLIR